MNFSQRTLARLLLPAGLTLSDDGSNRGVINVTFTAGKLSGASKAPPNGHLEGQTMSSVVP